MQRNKLEKKCRQRESSSQHSVYFKVVFFKTGQIFGPRNFTVLHSRNDLYLQKNMN